MSNRVAQLSKQIRAASTTASIFNADALHSGFASKHSPPLVAVITGASRGIGLGIAKELAKRQVRVCILAKTQQEHPKLEGTIYSARDELKALGL